MSLPVHMHIFTTKPDSFKHVRKAMLVRILPADAVIFAILIALIVFEPPISDGVTWPVVITTVIIMSVVSTYYSLKMQKNMLEHYRLTITDNEIIRQQLNTPDLVIHKNSVKKITRAKNGAFAIVADSNLNAIFVPAYMENIETLEQLLSDIRPITAEVSNWSQKAVLVLIPAGFILVGWGLLSENIFFFTTSGVVMCGFLVTGFIIIRRSRNYDRRMKRLSYVVFIPIISIVAAIVVEWLEV